MPSTPAPTSELASHGPLACVLTDPGQLEDGLVAALLEQQAAGREWQLMALVGPDEPLRAAAHERGLRPAQVFGFEVERAALGREHHLCDRLEQRLRDFAISEVLALAVSADAPADSAERIGAGIIGAACLSDGARALCLQASEGQTRLASDAGLDWIRARRATARGAAARPTVSAVISTWNKCQDVRANLLGIRAQSLPFDEVVVVDNASTDATATMIACDFPEVRLVVMPHSRYGACETFNIGFSSASCELIAILDDDVVLPPEWLAKTAARLAREPETTAVVSTKIVEPGTPDSYRLAPEINRERYMSTFRGCASLARKEVLARAGFYDERLFIYGNERDLTCRILNLGYRVLQYPDVETFHKTPFGIKMGKRSLYYHARNAFLGMLKYAPLGDLLRLPFLAIFRVLLRGGGREGAGEISDATGTIGIGRSVRETPGAWFVLIKAGCSVLYNLPYCLKRREPCRAPDFELPIE